MTDARYMTVSEAGRYLSLSRNSIKRLWASGEIDGYRTEGGHRRISVRSLDQFAAGDEVAAEIAASIRW